MSLNSIKLKLFNRIFQPWLYMLNPILRWKLQRQGAWGVVYMLHRVKEINPLGVEMNERMNVRPEYLEKVICKYRRQGFDFLSLDQLYNLIQNGRKPSRPFVVFTLDDGYVDNYTNAWPIFHKYNVPFAVYIATDFPEHNAILWWYAIEDYLKKRRSVHLDGTEYDLSNPQDMDNAFRILRASVLSLKGTDIREAICSLLGISSVEMMTHVDLESMTWKQIIEMSKDPLCTICGHTVSHPAFNRLSLQEIIQEVNIGCEQIQKHIGNGVSHFAYPYGSPSEVGEKEMLFVESAFSFSTITTCYSGFVGRSTTNPKRIPRMMLVDKMWYI